MRISDRVTPLAIAMWDFSWLERRWPGAGYEDPRRAVLELVERGYDAVRIDAYPHLIAVDAEREWELLPCWTVHDWGSPALNRVRIQPALNDFIAICRELNVHVGLSTWFREDSGGHQHHIPTPQAHANIWIKTLQSIEQAGLLKQILYVDLCNEWPMRCWAPFFRGDAGPQQQDWRTDASLLWMRQAIDHCRQVYPNLDYTFSFASHVLDAGQTDVSFLDLLEPHLWMTTTSDFYARLPYTFDRFSNKEYENVVRHAEPLYSADPQHWQSVLRSGIDTLAEWSRQTGKPLVTTECWAIVDYKDWPLLDWGWVKELCAIGTQHAARTGRWTAIATSNFCGPQGESSFEAQHAAHHFGRGAVGQTLSWSIIQRDSDSCNTLIAGLAEVEVVGQILADQPVGVLVCPSLPTGVRVGEVGREAQATPQRLMLDELAAVVERERLAQTPGQFLEAADGPGVQ